MDYQRQALIEKLNEDEWACVEISQPTSSAFWWVYEMLTFEKGERKVYVSFLIDLQMNKSKSTVDSIGFSDKDPIDRFEATSLGQVFIKNNWEARLDEALLEVKSL